MSYYMQSTYVTLFAAKCVVKVAHLPGQVTEFYRSGSCSIHPLRCLSGDDADVAGDGEHVLDSSSASSGRLDVPRTLH